MNDFEMDLCRAIYNQGILDNRVDQIEALFDACDIEGGPDGRISFTEVCTAIDNMGVFAKEPKVGE